MLDTFFFAGRVGRWQVVKKPPPLAPTITDIGSDLISDQKRKTQCNRTVERLPAGQYTFPLCSFKTKINLCALFVKYFVLYPASQLACASQKNKKRVRKKNVQNKNSQHS